MALPRFVLAGVPKAGTTSLYHYMRSQPGVYPSDVKEINFLSYPGAAVARERYPWLRFSVTDIDQYLALFADSGDRAAIDFSPSCFRSEVAIDRIRQFLPDPSLLVILRDPVDRAWSAHLHRIRKGYEKRSADDALTPGQRAVDMGFYSERIDEFQRAFGVSRVKVWLLEDMRADPALVVSDMLAYMGASSFRPVDDVRIHNEGSLPKSRVLHRVFPKHDRRRQIARVVPRPLLRPLDWAWRRNQGAAEPIPPALDARLRQLYADDVRQLEKLIERDLSPWLTSRG